MSGAEFVAYGAGYADASDAYGYPLWVAIRDAEPDWLEQDVAMLAALSVD